nr:hypothetical protein [Tanacetum cinerariifolium]
MALTFTDTHNMIAYLNKSDASEGFNQIIDFLNASLIQYAFTINLNIYVSCIKQFWSSVLVKKVNDVVRLQALIDRKKVIINEDTVRQALRLDDAESIDCIPNEEIFTELCISAKRTTWNEFSSSMASAVICLATGNGFSGVDTPLFEGMLVPQQAVVDVDDVVADDVAAVVRGIIADLDADKDVTLEDVEVEKTAKVEKNADVQGRLKESQAKVYHIDLEHADKDDVIEQFKEKGKQDNAVLRYLALKRKQQTEAQARKNMMVYLKNMAGFKMDYFKGMSYDAIRLIFKKYFNSNVAFLEKSKEQLEEEKSRALKRKTECYEEKAAKKQKLDEEVEELKNIYKLCQMMMISSLEELKTHSWFSKSQKLETVRVMWSSHYKFYNHSDDLAGRENISIDKTYRYWYKLMLLDNAADSKLRLLEQSAATVEQQYNLAYFFVKRIESARATPKAHLPYDKPIDPEVIMEKPVTPSLQPLPIITVDLHLVKKMMMRMMDPGADTPYLLCWIRRIESEISNLQISSFKLQNCKLLAVASLIFWKWQQPSLAVGTYTASGNSHLAVGMPCAFYSQQSSPKLDAPSALKFSRIK